MHSLFDIVDIYYTVDTSDPNDKGAIGRSLVNSGYYTHTDHTNKHFRFINLFSENDQNQDEMNDGSNQDHRSPEHQKSDNDLLVTLMDIHSEAIKELHKLHNYDLGKDKYDFPITYKYKQKTISMRCNYSFCVNGYCLNIRTKPAKTPYMEELDLPKAVRDILMSDELTDGLILISGETGDGKTTTATGLTVSRLRKYGGHCNAYEDPIEYDFQGFHGDNGFAVQTDVKGEFSPYIRASLRKYPITEGSILFVGEIRDPETAKIALQASAQGNLVIGTVHAMNIIATFKRLVTYVADGNTSADVAADLLSSSFRGVFHQNKTRNKKVTEGWHKFNIAGEIFFALNEETRNSISSAIRDGKFDSLVNIIKTQNTKCEQYNEGQLSLQELTNA